MTDKSSTKDLGLSSNERLFLKNRSIFKPNNYPRFKPKGIKIYTFHAGFKKKLEDLLIIIFDKPINSVNVYSKTSTPSAPIIWDKKHNKGTVRALVVNSGNANAHTGKKGVNIIMFREHGIKSFGLFLPGGAPFALLPLLIGIEIISFLIRPITLAVRLFANMMSGHILLKVLLGFA